jgi:7,8-dihydroneopterin aldolase/epimerase/oxygenase
MIDCHLALQTGQELLEKPLNVHYFQPNEQGAGGMDVIRLKDITIFPKLGVGEFEKEAVQKVTLDVDLFFDISKPARSDHIGDTVDYQQVYELIREISEERSYHLVEALAYRICNSILKEFSIERVRVRVRKLNLPFTAHMECVEVELEESIGGGA